MSASRQFNRPLLNSSALASTHNSNTVANIFTTGGNVGIGTTAPAYTLDVIGTIDATFYTGSNISISGSITSSTLRVTGNADLSTGLTTVTDLTGTNITSGTIRASTLISTSNLSTNNLTSTNLLATASTITNLSIPGTLTVVNITSTNLVETNITAGGIVVTGGSLRATFNSNTIGNIFTTGGNVGIANLNPAYTLDVNGTFEASNSNGLMLFASSGNLGVGTTSPGATLAVQTLNTSTIPFTVYSNGELYNPTGTNSGRSIWYNSGTVMSIANAANVTSGNQTATLFDIGAYIPGSGNTNIYLGCASGTTTNGSGNFVIGRRTGTSTWSETFRINAVGNVGIGTTAPAYTLDVNGTFEASNSNGLFFFASSGNVGINTTAPSNRLHVVGSTTNTGGIIAEFRNSTNGERIQIIDETSTGLPPGICSPVASHGVGIYGRGGNIRFLTTSSNLERMTITSTGNVGISTTSPSALLDIAGGSDSSGAQGTPLISLQYRNSSGGGFRHFIKSRHNAVASNDTGNGIDFYLNNSNTATGSSAPGTGNVLGLSITANGVGIGYTGPSAPLHVKTGVNYSWPTNGYYFSTNATITSAPAGGGSTSPNNSILAAGSITSAEGFFATSDIRIKNIKDEGIDTNLIDLLNPVQFTYKDILQQGTLTKFGFIAQNVKEHIPGATSIRKDTVPDIFTKCNIARINGKIHVHLENHDLENGDNIKVMVDSQDRTGRIVSVVNVIDTNTFVLELDLPSSQTELFIYGREVDDLLDVDYNIMSTLAFAGVKELRQNYKSLQEKNQRLEEKNQRLDEKYNQLLNFIQNKFPGELN